MKTIFWVITLSPMLNVLWTNTILVIYTYISFYSMQDFDNIMLICCYSFDTDICKPFEEYMIFGKWTTDMRNRCSVYLSTKITKIVCVFTKFIQKIKCHSWAFSFLFYPITHHYKKKLLGFDLNKHYTTIYKTRLK